MIVAIKQDRLNRLLRSKKKELRRRRLVYHCPGIGSAGWVNIFVLPFHFVRLPLIHIVVEGRFPEGTSRAMCEMILRPVFFHTVIDIICGGAEADDGDDKDDIKNPHVADAGGDLA